MAQPNTMNVSLPPALKRFVQQQVKAGRYRSGSEVLREAIRRLEKDERVLDGVRGKIAAGSKSARVNGPEAIKKLKQDLGSPVPTC